jgi:hypothetical protein
MVKRYQYNDIQKIAGRTDPARIFEDITISTFNCVGYGLEQIVKLTAKPLYDSEECTALLNANLVAEPLNHTAAARTKETVTFALCLFAFSRKRLQKYRGCY